MTEAARTRAGSGRLTESISRRISDMIVDRELRPGSALPTETEFVERFGVGRGVVREAIVRLRALGVVDVHHGRGMFVARLPVGLLQARLRRAVEDQGAHAGAHTVELREILLVAAVRMATAHGADPADLDRALRAVERVERAGIGEALESFYACLGQACGNPLAEQLLAGLGLVLRSADQARWQDADRSAIVGRLGAAVAAIRAGQEEAGAEAIRAALRGP